MNEKKSFFRVSFYNQGTVYEIYAKSIAQSSMFGFIEIEEIVFNAKTKVVVDPSEERLKAEFSGVKRIYIPMHSIIRIDEVDKEGTPKITALSTSNNVTQFPIYTPSGKGKF